MKSPAFLLFPATFALAACSAGSGAMIPAPQRAAQGSVTVSFKFPAPQARSSSNLRRPKYFSPATTTLAIALKSVNGAAVNVGTQGNIFNLSKICSQSGAFFYCNTTVTVVSGDDVLGVLAYSTKPLGTLSGNIPLSFAEGEVVIGSGSSAEPAGAEDTTGRLSVILAPVIFGGQLQEGANPQANAIPIVLSAFFDPSGAAVPQSAYQGPPDFANTPHLIDSDASGATFLSDVTSGAQGSDIAITSHSDQIKLVNTAGEASGKKVTATISYQPEAADPDATFTIPAYFDLAGSVSAEHNLSAGGSAAPLTFTCTSTGCTKGN